MYRMTEHIICMPRDWTSTQPEPLLVRTVLRSHSLTSSRIPELRVVQSPKVPPRSALGLRITEIGTPAKMVTKSLGGTPIVVIPTYPLSHTQ